MYTWKQPHATHPNKCNKASLNPLWYIISISSQFCGSATESIAQTAMATTRQKATLTKTLTVCGTHCTVVVEAVAVYQTGTSRSFTTTSTPVLMSMST